jgi:hypothetical protein
MKHFVFIGILVLFGFHVAQAQSIQGNFGIRLDGVPTAFGTPPAFPALGGHFGLEVRTGELSFGARVVLSSFVLLYWHGSLDVYGSYTLPDGLTPYAGVGVGFGAPIFVSGAYTDVHALLGLRLQNGFFVEVSPGLAFGQVCTQTQPPTTQSGGVRPQATPCFAFESVQVFIVGVSIGWAFILP